MAKQENPLTGEPLIKEVCRRLRVARSYWDAHNNAACRGERFKRSYSEGNRALALYNTLTKEQKDQIPQQLRVWRELPSVKNTLGHTERHPSRDESRSRQLSQLTGKFRQLNDKACPLALLTFNFNRPLMRFNNTLY
jgi:hypothetical protein